MDVFASSVNLVAVRIGGIPADDDHRFGHGKAESLAGMFQGAVVGFSGVYLVVESVRRLYEGGRPEHELVGLATMAVSTVASLWITWLLKRTAKATGSVALAADSLHYASDVWMNGGVFFAVGAVSLTGQAWIDPVTGLFVAFLVLKSSWGVMRASVDELMDRDLGRETVEDGRGGGAPRRAGGARRDRVAHPSGRPRALRRPLTVAFDRELSFAAAHRLSERARTAVKAAVPDAEVSVHADPAPDAARRPPGVTGPVGAGRGAGTPRPISAARSAQPGQRSPVSERPPSTRWCTPVTHRDRSDARNSTASTTSEVAPTKPSGCVCLLRSRNAS